MIVEAIVPQLFRNKKKASEIAKMCKRVQAKKDEVPTTPEMLEDYKKKLRHKRKESKE